MTNSSGARSGSVSASGESTAAASASGPAGPISCECAPSSARIRRIEARMSSIDGSCASALRLADVSVIGDSPFPPRSRNSNPALPRFATMECRKRFGSARSVGPSRAVVEIAGRVAAARSADPFVAHLAIVPVGIIVDDGQVESLRRQLSHCRVQLEGRDHLVTLGTHQRDLRSRATPVAHPAHPEPCVLPPPLPSGLRRARSGSLPPAW